MWFTNEDRVKGWFRLSAHNFHYFYYMKSILTILLITVTISAYSQSIWFNNRYLAPGMNWSSGKSIVETEDGYTVIAIGSGINGWSNKNVIFCFLDKYGIVQEWKYHGETYHHLYPAGYSSLLRLDDGSYILPVNGEQSECHPSYLYKFTHRGDTIWKKILPNLFTGDTCSSILRGIIQVENGDFVITGMQKINDDFHDILLMRTDSLGNIKWQRMYGTEIIEYGTNLIQTNDGGFLIGGFQEKQHVNISGEAVVIKTDSLGFEEWTNYYGSDWRENQANVKLSNDNNFIIGYGRAIEEPPPHGFSHKKIDLMKIDPMGDTIWYKQYLPPHYGNCINKLLKLDDNNYAAIGSYRDDYYDLAMSWIFKFNDDGDSIWYKEYKQKEGTNANFLTSGVQTEDKGFAMCGWLFLTDPPMPNPQQMWVIKVDSNGCDTCGTTVGLLKQERTGDEFTIYPNPVQNYIIIELEGIIKGEKRYTIFDINGKAFKFGSFKGASTMLDMSDLNSGVYFIRIISGEYTQTKKIIIN